MPSQAQPTADGSWCLLLHLKLCWALRLCYFDTFPLLISFLRSLHSSFLYATFFYPLPLFSSSRLWYNWSFKGGAKRERSFSNCEQTVKVKYDIFMFSLWLLFSHWFCYRIENVNVESKRCDVENKKQDLMTSSSWKPCWPHQCISSLWPILKRYTGQNVCKISSISLKIKMPLA